MSQGSDVCLHGYQILGQQTNTPASISDNQDQFRRLAHFYIICYCCRALCNMSKAIDKVYVLFIYGDLLQRYVYLLYENLTNQILKKHYSSECKCSKCISKSHRKYQQYRISRLRPAEDSLKISWFVQCMISTL